MDVSFDEKRLIELYRQLTPLHKENIMLCVANYAKHDKPVMNNRSSNNKVDNRLINLFERRATI